MLFFAQILQDIRIFRFDLTKSKERDLGGSCGN